jgi:signal transduction histidine kinase
MLLLARADEHAPSPHVPVDLDDLVLEEARRLRAVTALRVDTSAVGAGRVLGDVGGLRRVLRNVGENAARHAAGRIDIALDIRDGVVVLRVDDDGPGIPESERDRVLQRFVRLDDARSRDAGGSGLGLSIVDEVVRAHGGSLSIGRSPLGGARIEVTLPADDD